MEAIKPGEGTAGEDDLRFILCDANPYMAILLDETFHPVYCNTAVIEYFKFLSKKDALERLFPVLSKAIPEYQPAGRKSFSIQERINFAVRDGYHEFVTEFIFNEKPAPIWVSIKKIPWKNTFFIAGYLLDLNSLQDRELLRRDRLLQTVNNVAGMLLSSKEENFEDVIWEALGILGQSVETQRAYIWKNFMDGDKLCFSQLYEWAEGVEAVQNEPYAVRSTYDDIPLWRDTLQSNNYINDLVKNRPPYEREILESQGIISVLIIPIFIRGEFWGFIGFDDCKKERLFSRAEASILHSAAVLLISALLRNEVTKNLIKAREEALTSTKAKSEFLAVMSHEMRTPLNAVIGLAEIALQKELPRDVRTDMQKIYTSGSILLGIINDVLDISKIEAGNLGLVLGPYSTPSLINDTVNLNMVRIGSKPIVFTLEIDETLPDKLLGDELRIKQILNNLLSNAIKYTKEGKVLLAVRWHSIRESDSQSRDGEDAAILTFVISDTGQGVRKEDQEKIFFPYSQLNIKANRNMEGTGLGLSITKRLVEMMGGKIELQSTYGQGSVFTVTIYQGIVNAAPIGKEMADNLQHFRFIGKHSKELNRIMIDGGKVLVVDDVQMNIDVARGFLLPYGLVIDEAKSGEKAVEMVRNSDVSPYDIIFMDHMMPGMDGIEATRKIRSLGGYAQKAPVIALTANALAGNREMFLENGLDDFLAKPINVQKLDAVLEKWIPPSKRSEKQIVEPAPALNGSAVPRIAAVNTALGITNTGGSLSVYLNILAVFCRDVSERIPAIREALAAGDIATYTTFVHALKSACRNIGAEEAGDAVARLEKAGEEKNRDLMHTGTEPLLAELEQLIGNIKAALEEEAVGTGTEEDARSIERPVLETLKEALFSVDIQTVDNLLRECGMCYTDKKSRDFLFEIEQYILLFEYEKAAELVDRVLTGG